jgi:hypothetical protein
MDPAVTPRWHDGPELAAIDPGAAVLYAIMHAILEPLGLPDARLPAYGIRGEGCCRGCLLPAELCPGGLCAYCDCLEDLTWRAIPARHRPKACGCGRCRARVRDAREFAVYALLTVSMIIIVLGLYWTIR